MIQLTQQNKDFVELGGGLPRCERHAGCLRQSVNELFHWG